MKWKILEVVLGLENTTDFIPISDDVRSFHIDAFRPQPE